MVEATFCGLAKEEDVLSGGSGCTLPTSHGPPEKLPRSTILLTSSCCCCCCCCLLSEKSSADLLNDATSPALILLLAPMEAPSSSSFSVIPWLCSAEAEGSCGCGQGGGVMWVRPRRHKSVTCGEAHAGCCLISGRGGRNIL